MTEKELIDLLKQAKDLPEFGGDFDFDAQWETFTERYDFQTSSQPVVYTFKDYAQFAMHQLSHHMLRPAAVTMSAFAIIFAGWIGAVNASFDSVPGDYLYPVKLVTERVQLTFAAGNEQRGKLHVEFAERRLNEISEIKRSDRDGKDVRTKAAIESFTKEIQSANAAFVELNDEKAEDAVELAIVIDQKTDAFEELIAASEEVEETKEALTSATEALEEANDQAVEAIVDQHEIGAKPQTTESLQKNFQDLLTGVKTRITMSHGRLSVIEEALAGIDNSNAYAIRIDDARDVLTGNDGEISNAMNQFAAGGVRSAFDTLETVEQAVSVSEQIITELEIEISTELISEEDVVGSEEDVVPTNAPDSESEVQTQEF